MAIDGSGNVFVTGYSKSDDFVSQYVTIKYSNAGTPLWTNRYNGSASSWSVATAMAMDGDGNVFVTGFSRSGGQFVSSSGDYVTIKYSNAGLPLWTNRYNGPGNDLDEACAIAVDGNGNAFMTGVSSDIAYIGDFSYPRSDYATIKYSNDGVPLWTNRHNSGTAYAIAVDGGDNVFVAGGAFGGNIGNDYTTIKYSNAGVPLWTNRYNGPGNNVDEAKDMAVDSNGNVFVTGRSDGANSSGDYATIAYSNSGSLLWINRYTGPGYGLDSANAIAVDPSGNVFVTGDSGQDYATIKYGAVTLPPTAVLENSQAGAGGFSFTLTESGVQYAIQVSTNLTNWEIVRQGLFLSVAARTFRKQSHLKLGKDSTVYCGNNSARRFSSSWSVPFGLSRQSTTVTVLSQARDGSKLA